MNDYHDHIPDEQLEKYLDGQLSEDELAEFEGRLERDRELQLAIEQHRTFEAKLRASFKPNDATAEEIGRWIDGPVTRDSRPAKKRNLVIVAVSAVAAVVAWIAVAVQWNGERHNVEPFFQQRPLVALYREAVDQGFRPYYFCEDEKRFAYTFRKRQDVPLALKKTPEDRHMVGLSYLGGLSRDTTAILAYVEEQPVIVFVDRRNSDNEEVAAKNARGSDALHVHRSELGELVVYEVTPFGSPKMSQYLAVDE